METSNLNKKITIEKIETTKDSAGYNSGKIITEIGSYWASIKDFYSKELYASFGTKLEGGFNVTIRYSKKIESLKSIEYKDKLFIILKNSRYKIISTDYHNDNRKYITFKVVQVI